MYKILVTGGCGFIGSNFIYYCLNKNNKVLNFDKLTYAGNLNNLKKEESNKNYHFIQGDICNKNKLTQSIEKFKPDFIVNFAAETHVDRSIENSSTFIKTNILGTSVLLDCCLENIDKNINEFKLLHISTDEV